MEKIDHIASHRIKRTRMCSELIVKKNQNLERAMVRREPYAKASHFFSVKEKQITPFFLNYGEPMARMFKDIQKIVEKLSKEDRKKLLHSLDHCLLMANKFEETGKPEHYVRMKSACETFLETLNKFEERASE